MVKCHEIIILDTAVWTGYMLDFSYTSDYYYDVEVQQSRDGFQISFIKKKFSKIFVNKNTTSDKLYQPHWEDATGYGIVDHGELIAVIETWAEEWSNRLRVTELWIHERFRRQGIGTELMNIAKKQALEEKHRAIILETQSCNSNAIAFYLSQGFQFIGCDTCCYSSEDIERKEVRMEMGYIINENKGDT